MNEDIELNDGGIIEAPDEEFTIRRRDVNGNLEEIREIGNTNHNEWLILFPEAVIKLHLKQASDILEEFIEDVESCGIEIVGEDWPDLLVTYQHAVEFLS